MNSQAQLVFNTQKTTVQIHLASGKVYGPYDTKEAFLKQMTYLFDKSLITEEDSNKFVEDITNAPRIPCTEKGLRMALAFAGIMYVRMTEVLFLPPKVKGVLTFDPSLN